MDAMEQAQEAKIRDEQASGGERRGHGAGRLYLCATPIGNLGDMTYRAVRMLAEAELIAAEDTRHTRQLLAHFDIHTRLTSYHEHNKFEKGPELVAWILAGHDLVCVSDAGLPGISDPGSHLAELAIAAGIEVSPLPGASAGLSALICSGLSTQRFAFVGFLPKTAKKQRELLEEVREHRETLIFYEAPHRLRETLKLLAGALGASRRAAACRELTKRFEEFRRATLHELVDYYAAHEPRGEFVLIVEGAGEAAKETEQETVKDPVGAYLSYLAKGAGKKEAMRQAAKELGLSRRAIYAAVLAAEEEGRA